MSTRKEIEASAKEFVDRVRGELDMLLDNIADNVADMAVIVHHEAQKLYKEQVNDLHMTTNLAGAIHSVEIQLKLQLFTGDLLKRMKDKLEVKT